MKIDVPLFYQFTFLDLQLFERFSFAENIRIIYLFIRDTF